MLRSIILFILFIGICTYGNSQTNIHPTNPEVIPIWTGNYDAADYTPADAISAPNAIFQDLVDNLEADSLKAYLLEMLPFFNRNTGADTLSTTTGMGAARIWAHEKFESFNDQNGDRLIVSYLQFDQMICEMGSHKNITATLPGTGPNKDEVILIEAHYDSRCHDVCDIDCQALGMEDNGSGSALVLELARVMSQYELDRTIIFMLTIGEEQGLHGATALAEYCVDNDIKVYAVLNNDIVGGVICGETASPPGCPGLNDVDSTNVRLYSFGFIDSPSKGLARYVKLQYQDNVRDLMTVKPIVNIMGSEDRVGRGGDHIPFRERGYSAVRFTSANEHGAAATSDPEYHDRQHTEEDILGVDTDADGILDSFFVDFNYLNRNAILNGNAAVAIAMSPDIPDFESLDLTHEGLRVSWTSDIDCPQYAIGLRSESNDFDTLVYVTESPYFFKDLQDETFYVVSVACVDEDGIESLFSADLFTFDAISSIQEVASSHGVHLLQNRPNPFDDQTTIAVVVAEEFGYESAEIIVNNAQGKRIYQSEINLDKGVNSIQYTHQSHSHQDGVYYYSLVVDGQMIDTKAMVYAY